MSDEDNIKWAETLGKSLIKSVSIENGPYIQHYRSCDKCKRLIECSEKQLIQETFECIDTWGYECDEFHKLWHSKK